MIQPLWENNLKFLKQWNMHESKTFNCKRIGRMRPYKDLGSNVHNFITHNGQKVETEQMSSHRRMEKQIVVHSLKKLLLRERKKRKKEMIYDTHTTWMNLKNNYIWVKDVRPPKKTTYCIFYLFKMKQFLFIENETIRDGGKKKGELGGIPKVLEGTSGGRWRCPLYWVLWWLHGLVHMWKRILYILNMSRFLCVFFWYINYTAMKLL